MEYRTCANPECPNSNPLPIGRFPPSRGESRRELCDDCYRAYKREYQHLQRQKPAIAVPAQHHSRGCADCTMRRRCRKERLWIDGPLPCEGLLDDEIGVEFDPDSSPTVWRMPLLVMDLEAA